MKKILVVEDDNEMRVTLKAVLERHGYEVDVAEDGISALNKLWVNTYDAAVTDVMMPGINGLKLMSIARTIPPQVNFLVISGNSSPENKAEAFRLGAKAFVQKPFTPNELLQAVKIVMGNY